MEIRVTSPAFAPHAAIPVRYTCDGENISPPLAWEGLPDETVTLAVICDDPDAAHGPWVHWVLWNLSPRAQELAAHVPPRAELPDGTRQGINDAHTVGYDGPCPPPGHPHHYHFKVYALSTALALNGTVTKSQLLHAMQDYILAQGELVGLYGR